MKEFKPHEFPCMNTLSTDMMMRKKNFISVIIMFTGSTPGESYISMIWKMQIKVSPKTDGFRQRCFLHRMTG